MSKTLRVIVAIVLLQVAFVAAWFAGNEDESKSDDRPGVVQVTKNTEPNVPAPSASFRRLDGGETGLAELRGRPVIVHFWGTWCPPCVEELPTLLAADFGEAELIAVAVADDPESLREFFAGEVPSEVMLDREGTTAFGVNRLPVTLLVSADGRIVRRWDGARRWTGDEVSNFLE